jgi:hypothetical protein
MTDLQVLFTHLDALSPDEFAQVRAYFDDLTLYAHPMRGKTPEERVAGSPVLGICKKSRA